MADQIALKLVGEDGYVVTEAGFGVSKGKEMGRERMTASRSRYSVSSRKYVLSI